MKPKLKKAVAVKGKGGLVDVLVLAQFREDCLRYLEKILKTSGKQSLNLENLSDLEIQYQIKQLGKTMDEVSESSEMSILRSLKEAMTLVNSIALSHYKTVKERS